MIRAWRFSLVVLALALFSAPTVSAQATASITGIVKDAGGGVVPGTTVVVREEGTGRAYEVVTDDQGRYTVPALLAGAYSVTASLTGFKAAEVKGIRLAPGQPVAINLTLEIGDLTETVVVTSSAELINTETATVAATLNSDQLLRMPTPNRNAMNAIAFLPGVNQAGTVRDSTINGLPESFLSITLDGVNNNDNFLRTTDGMFASVYPRQDAVEAVSVTLAAAGAQVGGGAGAVTMAFQTRSGTNRFSGSGYDYYRNPKLNTNYYFNRVNSLPKNQVKLHQFGGRVGGPIVIPKVYDGRNEAFFFFHYERIIFPNSFTRTRTVLNSRVLDGWFRYQVGSGVQEVNVLQLAAQNGQISTKDPIITQMLQNIEAATRTSGARSAANDPLYDSYVWLSPADLLEDQPTARLDYNLGSRHRLSGSFSVITAQRLPDYLNGTDPRFPGAPNWRDFKSVRQLMSMSMRSSFGRNMINEVRGGLTAFYGASNFGYTSAQESNNGPKTFEDMGGYAISIPTSATNWFTTNGPSWRAAPTYSIEDTVTWQHRKHSVSFGGSFMLSTAKESAQQMVKGISIGFNTDFDPAVPLFTTANFPGASSSQLSDARAVYAILTGRVSAVTSQAALDAQTTKYTELGARAREGGIRVFGFFVQDSWKVTPTLTLTGGFRYDVQTPFKAYNSTMSAVTMASVCGMSGMGDGGLYSKCNFLQPGATGGAVPEFIQLEKGTEGYNTDWNNVAPSVSVAWRPNVQTGFLRTLMGDPDQATLRAGFSVAYERQGLSQWTGVYGGNQGSTISLTRDANTGLVPAGEAWPVLLSQTNRLYSASFKEDPTYPIAVRLNRADSLNAFAPDVEIGQVKNWTVGFARSISRDTAVEIRYVGNRGSDQWSTLNYNGIRGENLLANGFLNEFKLAMANLQANNASGVSSRRGSFAYFGPGTGTSPLPIYLAYFTGRTDATNTAAYTNASTTWANATIASRLSPANPNPTTSASDLDGNTTRRNNALAAGYPANFFVPNPAMNGVNVTDSGAFSDYHALQLELRRRLSKGLSASVNYQFAAENGSAFDGFSFGRVMEPSSNVRHAIKMQWDWQIPVGRDQRFGRDMHPILDGILGGWSFNGVGRVQARLLDFGNVRLVGMTKADLQKMWKYDKRVNPTTGLIEVWMLPEDVVLNTRRAFSVSNTTLDGYSTSLGPPEGRYIAPANSAACIQVRSGDCAPRNLMMLAPWFGRFDFSATKRFNLPGRMNIEVRVDMLNVFDNINFNPVANPGTSASIFRTTSAYTDTSNTYDPGGRIGQIMLRFNW